MSLIEELAQNGVSAEDLEKAASVRLFEKVAAAEGIDFDQLNDEQIEHLYSHFVENVLPGISNDGGDGAWQTEVAPAANDAEKAASVHLFYKTAEAEEIDLTKLSEDELNGLYGHFLTEVLPTMLQAEEEKAASAGDVEEAQAKLAEVEILGRHMARAYHDELGKIAMVDTTGMGDINLPSMGPSGRTVAKGLGAAAGLTAAGYGGKKLYDKYKGKKSKSEDKEASAVLFDKLAEERAGEILEANGIGQEYEQEEGHDLDALITARAVEMLQGAGYEFEE